MSLTGNNGTAEQRSPASEQPARAGGGGRLALSVYQRRREAITRRIFERLNSRYRFVAWQDAEDAYAELFPNVFARFRLAKASGGTADPETAAENYLVKAGINRAIDRYRHERGWTKTAIGDAGGRREIPTDPGALPGRSVDPLDQIELRARVRAMFGESKALPEKDRKMFWAYHLKGKKIREIAAESEVSERWVKKRIALFRMRLEAAHERPALVPFFVYQLYWRLRDLATPASTLVAQQEPASAGFAKICAAGCILIVGGVGAQTAYEQAGKRDHGSKRRAAARMHAVRVPAPPRYPGAAPRPAEGSGSGEAESAGATMNGDRAPSRDGRRAETGSEGGGSVPQHEDDPPTASSSDTETKAAPTPRQSEEPVVGTPAPVSTAGSARDVSALDP